MTLGDFTSQAHAYARARPAYPEEMLEDLLHIAEIGEGDPVCDLGAGTGILTRQLAQRSLRVTAVEPNPRMIDLAGELPGVHWREGTFEVTGLPSDTFDLAIAGQSMHWADLPRALPEIHRILRPDGHFCALWNDREADRHPVLAYTYDLIRTRVPGFDELYRARDWSAHFVSTGHFCDPVTRALRHVVPMSCERYIDLWRSHNMLNHLVGPDVLAEILGELAAKLEREHWQGVRVPYVCRAWIVRRC